MDGYLNCADKNEGGVDLKAHNALNNKQNFKDKNPYGGSNKTGVGYGYNTDCNDTWKLGRTTIYGHHTKNELKSIGSPKEWGVLPIRPMGATIRFTKDKRILIRNTAEVSKLKLINEHDLKQRVKIHSFGIKKRFPNLPDDLIENSWSGIVCRSGNGSQIFEKIENNIFAAGCYNGSGIGVGTLFGEQIALMASNQQTDEISIIEERKKPNWLPPQPFLNLGIYTRLAYERFKARSET